MIPIRWLLGGLLSTWWLAATLPAAMDIRLYDEARHDRFYEGGDADDALRAAGDWSGVGQSGLTWATMVSPTFFLSASHFHAGASSQATFYDVVGTGHTYTIGGGQQILDSDLWLGWLAAPIPEADGISSTAVYGDIGAGFIGCTVIVFGQDDPQGEGEQRLGRNVIDGVGTERTLFVPPPGHTADELDNSQQLMVFSDQPAGESTVGGDEMRLWYYDSGGPTFAVVGGSPSLVGINYFIYDVGTRLDPAQDDYAGSGVSSVSAYIAAINAAMAARGSLERLTVVPEPGMAWLALSVAIAFGLRRPPRRGARSG